jgi:hypothetical protein
VAGIPEVGQRAGAQAQIENATTGKQITWQIQIENQETGLAIRCRGVDIGRNPG